MKLWITRDKNSKIFAYSHKPIKIRNEWVCQWGVYFLPIEETNLPEGVNPQWEDTEPIEVEFKIEKI